jgi:hypothetical protein
MRLSVRDDARARERAHAAARAPRAPKLARGDRGYLGERPDTLDPLTCRCRDPAPVADVDRLTTTVTVTCLTCGTPRAVLDRLDLAALAVARRAQR